MTNAPSDHSRLLSRVKEPYDLASFTMEELEALGQELRENIIETVSHNGGHLAPSLGVIELTMALLRIFNPKRDKIVWDVGHQAYAYKLLTGRAENFHTLRCLGGISGFPRMSESPYDHFGVGHASTSISAALGMAMARDLAGQDHHVVAVIGDGSLTSGMAYEAMNQAGAMGRKLIVVLNDNEMSISRNVGALSFFFSRNLSSRWVRRVKREIEGFLLSIPGVGDDMVEVARRSKSSFKSFFTPGILFEALRFKYIGPVDGHNLHDLDTGLKLAAELDEPVLLHVLTQKGRGYTPAELHPTAFHGVGCFDAESGCIAGPEKPEASYTSVFSEALCEMAEQNPKIVAITAAMPEGTGLAAFSRRFPNRFVDVGICEPHAVTFAAGLATQGFSPVLAIYSTFMQRSYDQIVHDVCLQNLPVTLCLDRAGLVGEDGATHHGAFDISYLRHIPNLYMLAPRDQHMLRRSLATAVGLKAPVSLRYPRGLCPPRPMPAVDGQGEALPLADAMAPLEPGRGEFLRRPKGTGDKEKKVAILATGSMLVPAMAAAQNLFDCGLADISVFDPVWLKPLDSKAICELARSFQHLLLLEENAEAGGFASSVLELLRREAPDAACRIHARGLPDCFVEHGKSAALHAELGLDAKGIEELLRLILV